MLLVSASIFQSQTRSLLQCNAVNEIMGQSFIGSVMVELSNHVVKIIQTLSSSLSRYVESPFNGAIYIMPRDLLKFQTAITLLKFKICDL